jgi:hypothetical protein
VTRAGPFAARRQRLLVLVCGYFFKQSDMNFLRSAPFMSLAWLG